MFYTTPGYNAPLCERLQLFDTYMLYRPTVLYCGDTRLVSELHRPGFFQVDFYIISYYIGKILQIALILCRNMYSELYVRV